MVINLMHTKINIQCIMHVVRDHSFLCGSAVRLVVCGVSVLLTCGKHLHGHIISLRAEVRVQKTGLIPTLFIEVSTLNQRRVEKIPKG